MTERRLSFLTTRIGSISVVTSDLGYRGGGGVIPMGKSTETQSNGLNGGAQFSYAKLVSYSIVVMLSRSSKLTNKKLVCRG